VGDRAESPLGKLRLGEEGRDGGDEDDHCDPWAEAHQQNDQRDQGDHLLQDLQNGIDNRQRAAVCLAAGVLQHVIEDRVLKELQVKFDRFIDHHAVDVVCQLGPQNAVRECTHLPAHRTDQHQPEFQKQVGQDQACAFQHGQVLL